MKRYVLREQLLREAEDPSVQLAKKYINTKYDRNTAAREIQNNSDFFDLDRLESDALATNPQLISDNDLVSIFKYIRRTMDIGNTAELSNQVKTLKDFPEEDQVKIKAKRSALSMMQRVAQVRNLPTNEFL